MTDLTPWETIVYEALCIAADRHEPCPVNLDLEMLIGANSTSMGPKMVRRLEEKGLIRVVRYQKFREVEIVATGKTTARSVSQHIDRPHVPRGAGSRAAVPTERKVYRKGRL